MNNPFGLDKGMEALESGQQAVKQQLKTTAQTVTSQITGQQPVPSANKPITGSVKTEVLSQLGVQPGTPQTESQKVTQQANQKMVDDIYAPSKPQDIQVTLSQENLAKNAQEDQKKQQDIKILLQNYFNPEVEQKMAQLRNQRVQEKEQEEKQEDEEKKMEELQVEEQKKKDMNPTQKTAENKAAGMG